MACTCNLTRTNPVGDSPPLRCIKLFVNWWDRLNNKHSFHEHAVTTCHTFPTLWSREDNSFFQARLRPPSVCQQASTFASVCNASTLKPSKWCTVVHASVIWRQPKTSTTTQPQCWSKHIWHLGYASSLVVPSAHGMSKKWPTITGGSKCGISGSMSCSSTRIRRLLSVSTGWAPRCTDNVASLCSDEPSLERVFGLSGTGSSDQYLITKHMASYLMASEGHVLHWMRVFRISFLRFQTAILCHPIPRDPMPCECRPQSGAPCLLLRNDWQRSPTPSLWLNVLRVTHMEFYIRTRLVRCLMYTPGWPLWIPCQP